MEAPGSLAHGSASRLQPKRSRTTSSAGASLEATRIDASAHSDTQSTACSAKVTAERVVRRAAAPGAPRVDTRRSRRLSGAAPEYEGRSRQAGRRATSDETDVAQRLQLDSEVASDDETLPPPLPLQRHQGAASAANARKRLVGSTSGTMREGSSTSAKRLRHFPSHEGASSRESAAARASVAPTSGSRSDVSLDSLDCCVFSDEVASDGECSASGGDDVGALRDVEEQAAAAAPADSRKARRSNSSSSGSSSRNGAADGKAHQGRSGAAENDATAAAVDWRTQFAQKCAEARAKERQLPPSVQDIEAGDPNFELFCADYGPAFYGHLRARESALSRPKPHPSLRAGPRRILVDWMVEVCEDNKMQWSSTFLAVELLDRALGALPPVANKSLQLLGCACILLAAKHEEIFPLSVADLAYFTDNSFKKEDIAAAERQVAEALGFRLASVTAASFAHRYAAAAGSNPREAALVRYLLSLSLLDYELARLKPSLKAASALHLARQMLPDVTRPVWDAQIAHYTGYEPSDEALQRCVRALHVLHWGAEGSPQKAVRRTFSSPENFRVGSVTCLLAEQLKFEA